jgi:glycosyltransferase involved in cell wall biosynthesis
MLRILTPVYNATAYLPKCIDSLRRQSMELFQCYILDDCSTDKSATIAERLTSSDDRFCVIRNTEKLWQPGNYQQVLRENYVHDEDIVVCVDGDDWLPDADVLSRVVAAYQDPTVWLTWGSFWHLHRGQMHNGLSCAVDDVTQQRKAVWHTSHLRTWKAFLWRAIRDEDLRGPSGCYWETAGDLAFMYPMLEMATNSHAKYLPEYNYVYNHDNPLCDSSVRGGLQKHYEHLIRNMPVYAPLIRT